jgi:internalin A
MDLPGAALLRVFAGLQGSTGNIGNIGNIGGTGNIGNIGNIGSINALRGTCRGVRDILDTMVVTSATMANYRHDVGEEGGKGYDGKGGKGFEWLARHFPALATLDVAADTSSSHTRHTDTACMCDADSMASMRSLTTLKARNRWLPAKLALPPSLLTLDVYGCRMSSLPCLPASLTDVDVSVCGLTDLEWTRPLVALRRLCVAWNLLYDFDMSALAEHPAVKYLDISGCNVPRLVIPPGLEVFKAKHCGRLGDLSSLSVATCLRSVNFRGSKRVTTLAGIGALKQLTDVDIMCTGVPDLSDLRLFGALESVVVSVNTAEDEMTLAGLGRTLVSLSVGACAVPCALSPDMTALRSLCINNHSEHRLDYALLPKLTSLVADGHYVDDVELAHIGRMTDLRVLRGMDVNNVSDFAPFAALTSLETLVIQLGRQWAKTPVADMSAIASLTGLRTFEIHGCNRPCNLVPLASLSAFTTLCIPAFCDGDLGAVTALTGLRELSIKDGEAGGRWGVPWVGDLSPLTALSALTSLTISDFPGVTALPRGLLCELRHLDMYNCPQVSDLSPLTTLTAMRSLYLSKCAVQDLAPVGELRSITDMRLLNLPIEDLSPLSVLAGLRHLSNRHCCCTLCNLTCRR